MTLYDVFNGDADGLCALQQLRLAEPEQGELVTGVKRDNQLLRRVFPEPGDAVTVLDISLDVNRDDVVRILSSGARVTYFDHHFSGDVPDHASFRPYLDPSPSVCTSLLVDAFLDGRHRLWAIVGAAGDNLEETARRLAGTPLPESRMDRLCELGRLLNYNSYGRTVADLHFAPDALHREMRAFSNPLDFIDDGRIFHRLQDGYAADLEQSARLTPYSETSTGTIYVLPDEPWARRISGEIANERTRRAPDTAVAVLVPNTPTCYMVSLRVSANGEHSAAEFCRRYPSGGGRRTAGGINHLPAHALDDFMDQFRNTFR